MVASVSALSSAGQAASYYEADDYYAEGGMAPSEWLGEGAEKLGLSGEVDREKFAELLEGRMAGQQLGTTRDGKVEHRPGWDITLSAPKSVSIMAEVAGDKRLIKAHGAALKVALAMSKSTWRQPGSGRAARSTARRPAISPSPLSAMPQAGRRIRSSIPMPL